MINRRNFLKFAGTSCVALPVFSTTGCTHKQFYNPDQDIIIGGGQFRKNGTIHNMLAICNLQQRETQLVDTDFLPHETLVDPNDKKRLIVFEKNGTQAAVIDLNSHTVITQLTADETNIFSGYGTFNEKGELIYCIETNTDTSDGRIIIRDSNSFNIIGELSTFGKNPQACKLIDQGKTIVVANKGSSAEGESSSASIVYIDTQTNKQIEEIKLVGQKVNSCYFALSKDNRLIATTEPEITKETLTGVSSGKKSEPNASTETIGQVRISNQQHVFTVMTEPTFLTEKLFGNAPGICIDEQHNTVAITHPQANLITFWSIDNRKLIKAMSVPNPRSITLTLNSKHYIVSYATDSSSILINTKNFIADKKSIMQPTYATGEHIINWSKTLTEIMPGNIYS